MRQGDRDRTLDIKRRKTPEIFFSCKKNKNYQIFFGHISSSYAKILGETNFQPGEFPRSGSKAKDVKETERAKVNYYNG